MSKRATATVKVIDWKRDVYDERTEPKLARVSFAHTFTGDVEGQGALEYLMVLREDGSASFVGVERVVGRLGERSGSFVLSHSGTFENGLAKVRWFVVPGSGTGELRGLRGEGGFTSEHAMSFAIELDYDLGSDQ